MKLRIKVSISKQNVLNSKTLNSLKNLVFCCFEEKMSVERIYNPAKQPTQNKIFTVKTLNTKAAYEFVSN